MEEVHRELLKACGRAQREQALALLDLHPALLNAGWAGDEFEDGDVVVVEGETALILASCGGDAELVLALLERGADVDAQSEAQWSAVMAASYRGHIAALTHLLDKGPDLHAGNDVAGRTALHLAAMYIQPAACELLLSRGADLLAEDDHGRTALDVYGRYADPSPTEEAKEQALARMRAAWEAGPHPSQVQRRRDERWARRWPFVRVLVCCDFQPTAARMAMLALLHPPLPPDVSIPQLADETPAQHLALLRDKVFTHPGLWKIVASFL